MNTHARTAKTTATPAPLDAAILAAEGALRTLFAKTAARRVCPTLPEESKVLGGSFRLVVDDDDDVLVEAR